MPKKRSLRPVDADYATSGPNQKTLSQSIAAPAEALFRCLEDGPAWKEWLGIDVEWTSPPPYGVGATRSVTTNGQTIDEYFLVWERGRRMNFRFDQTTLPMAAFAEDYRIVSSGATTCVLEWSYAYEWDGPLPSIGAPLFGAVFTAKAKRSLKKLAKLMESSGSRFAA